MADSNLISNFYTEDIVIPKSSKSFYNSKYTFNECGNFIISIIDNDNNDGAFATFLISKSKSKKSTVRMTNIIGQENQCIDIDFSKDNTLQIQIHTCIRDVEGKYTYRINIYSL